MTGSARLLFFHFPPAPAPVHPQNSPPKSFAKRNLPLSHTPSIFCPESIPQVLQNDDFAKILGEGVPQSDRAVRIRLHPCGMISTLYNSTATLVSAT